MTPADRTEWSPEPTSAFVALATDLSLCIGRGLTLRVCASAQRFIVWHAVDSQVAAGVMAMMRQAQRANLALTFRHR